MAEFFFKYFYNFPYRFDLELNEILTGEINLEGLTYHSRSTQIVIGLNRELFFFHSVENLNEVFSYDVRTHKLTNRGVLYNTDPRCRYNGRFGDIIVAGGTIYAANIRESILLFYLWNMEAPVNFHMLIYLCF